MPELPENINESIRNALHEDVGGGDITASLLAPSNTTAKVVCRQNATLCGIAWFNEVFRQIDTGITIQWQKSDGDKVQANETLCELQGLASNLLTAERTALNFLQTLSATATQTACYVDAVKHTNCKILDTRKTIPGLRLAQKYAVRCGGGVNHRMGLYDAILIKENHIATAGSIRKAIGTAKQRYPNTFIEIEVENIAEFEQAMEAEPDRILLDNFSMNELAAAVELNCNCNQLEASGNITLENISEIAETGVDYISTGSITKNIQAIDLSMQITEQ